MSNTPTKKEAANAVFFLSFVGKTPTHNQLKAINQNFILFFTS